MTNPSYETVHQEFLKIANKDIASHSQRFFKTAKGEYGEGDVFLGLRVPQIRGLVKKHKDLTLHDVKAFMKSKFHEERLFACFYLVQRYEKSKTDEDRQSIYDFYFQQRQFVNNWDLVDSSAHKIVGPYLFDKDRSLLYELAKSRSLWDRRIAVISCMYFIKKHDFSDILEISKLLLHDSEDLIHKAVGWMLREVGNKDKAIETQFLDTYATQMPRTMLRYAIEKFNKAERMHYLQK